jgi:predicted outer membrane repeat protein
MFPTFGKHFEWYHFTIGVEKKKTCFELQRLCPPSTVQNKNFFYHTIHLKGEILMMKSNVWKKILPALVAAATVCGGNAIGQTYVPNDPPGGTLTLLDNPSAFYGIIDASDTSATALFDNAPNNNLLVIGGGIHDYMGAVTNGKPEWSGAVLNGNDQTNATGVFAISNISGGNLSGVLQYNVLNLTFTGGNAVDASAYGGGAYVDGFGDNDVILIQDDAFINNKVTANTGDAGGGGLFLYNSKSPLAANVKAELINIAATGNVAKGVTSAYGGGVLLRDISNIDIKEADISGNTVIAASANALAVGGGLAISGATGGTAISNTMIQGNTAEASGTDATAAGGGLAFDGSIGATISNSTIQGNTTKASGTNATAAGGGLVLNNSEVTVIDTDFIDNKADSAGGAIYADAASKLMIHALDKDVVFKGNSAADGNSIYAEGEVVFVTEKGKTITDYDGFFIKGAVSSIREGEVTIWNSVALGGLAALEKSTINTNGEVWTTVLSTAGYSDATINVQSGTTNANAITNTGTHLVNGVNTTISGGTVNIESGAYLILDPFKDAAGNVLLKSDITTLTGNGYLLFNNIDSIVDAQDLLTVTNDKLGGRVTAIDTLGTGVVKVGNTYRTKKDGIARIADGYLAIASIPITPTPQRTLPPMI